MVPSQGSAEGTIMGSNLYEARVPRYVRALIGDNQLWGLILEASLESGQLAGTLTIEKGYQKVDRCAKQFWSRL